MKMTASRRSSAPPWAPNSEPGVLGAGVALDQRLEQIAERAEDGDRQAQQQRVALGHPGLVEAGHEHRHDRHEHPADEPLDRLVGRDRRGQRTAAEQPAAQVGAGVGQEGAHHDVDQDRVAVVDLTQEHGVGEGHADPPDAEHRAGDGDRRRSTPAGGDDRQKRHRQRRHGDLEDVALGAEVRGDDHRRRRHEADDRRRAPAWQHPVELVQAHERDRQHEQRPGEASDVDECDRDHRRRNGDEHPGKEVGAAARARAEAVARRRRGAGPPGARCGARRAGRSRRPGGERRPDDISAPRSVAGGR